MIFYLRAKKLDISSGDLMVVTINSEDAKLHGIHAGQDVQISWGHEIMNASIDISEKAIAEGEVGLFADAWRRFEASGGDSYEIVQLRILQAPESIEHIKKKLKGGKLNYEELYEIMRDISSHRLGTIETTYFAACGYNPGFDEEEIFFATKAMAETGDMLRFEGVVADKHSIGGVPGKGVTPIVVPIISSAGLVVPNTSTKAITSASATTDMLDVIMPMTFSKEKMEAMVMKVGACMVWGGGLELAPADDEMIRVEKPLKIESFDKFVVSILAKKIAPGIQHLLIDMPYGPGTKVKTEEDSEYVEGLFKRIGGKFGINVQVYKRKPAGPDGDSIGPALECIEFLKVLEQHPDRSLQLEKLAVEMAGQVLEMTEKAPAGKGYEMALDIVKSGNALEQLHRIVEVQGGGKDLKSEDIKVGEITFDCLAKKSGTIKFIDNKDLMDVCRGLGNPYIKEAGIYLRKRPGDTVQEGDVLATLYATTDTRLSMAKSILEEPKNNVFHIE